MIQHKVHQRSSMPLGMEISDRDLPVLSPVAVRTLQLLQDPGLTNGTIAHLVQQDDLLHLSERILRVANSAYSSPRTPIRNVATAISRLGRRQLHDLIVVAAVGKLYDSEDPYIQKLWNHAIATGIASLTLAKSYPNSFVDEAFLAGVFHDIGKVIVYLRYPFLYWRYWFKVGYAHGNLKKIEESEFPNLSHTLIGRRVIRKWNLSDRIANAAGLHHELEFSIPADRKGIVLPCIVSLANVIVNNLGINTPVSSWPETASLACARYLQFDLDQVTPICERLQDVFEIHNVYTDRNTRLNNQSIKVAV